MHSPKRIRTETGGGNEKRILSRGSIHTLDCQNTSRQVKIDKTNNRMGTKKSGV
jgi:hypothetical protein